MAGLGRESEIGAVPVSTASQYVACRIMSPCLRGKGWLLFRARNWTIRLPVVQRAPSVKKRTFDVCRLILASLYHCNCSSRNPHMLFVKENRDYQHV